MKKPKDNTYGNLKRHELLTLLYERDKALAALRQLTLEDYLRDMVRRMIEEYI